MLGDDEDDAMRCGGGDGDGRVGIVTVCATGSGACSSFNRRAGSLVHASAKLRCAHYGVTMIRPSMAVRRGDVASWGSNYRNGRGARCAWWARVIIVLGVAGSLRLRIKGVDSGVIQ